LPKISHTEILSVPHAALTVSPPFCRTNSCIAHRPRLRPLKSYLRRGPTSRRTMDPVRLADTGRPSVIEEAVQ
jgi:hypothetical protein